MARPKTLVRCNTRIRPDQDKFVKDFSKKKAMTEGEVVRLALDKLMETNS